MPMVMLAPILRVPLNREIVEKVLSNAFDVGLLGAPADDERLAMKPFFKDELVVIVPRGHEWALRDSVRPPGSPYTAVYSFAAGIRYEGDCGREAGYFFQERPRIRKHRGHQEGRGSRPGNLHRIEARHIEGRTSGADQIPSPVRCESRAAFLHCLSQRKIFKQTPGDFPAISRL